MPTSYGVIINLNDYCDRFFSSLYGSDEDEEGTLWKDVYEGEWEEILEGFDEYLVFCKKFKHFPSHTEFLFFILYLEYRHISNVDKADFRCNDTFFDLTFEIYSEVIKYLSTN